MPKNRPYRSRRRSRRPRGSRGAVPPIRARSGKRIFYNGGYQA